MGGKWSCTQTKNAFQFFRYKKKKKRVKRDYVKKNCEHEYKETNYQLKIEKEKKEIWYLQPRNRKSIQTAKHKNCNKKAKKLKGRKRETDLK